MIIDARSLPDNEIIETEVAIVGAGAAGITLAREFIGQPFRVCLLEAGNLEFDAETQSLNKGENIGLPYSPLHMTRLRYFGGTTNIWAGWCRPFDENDFKTRDWVPHSGWPFDKSHLDTFYKRAQSILQLGPYDFNVNSWETKEHPYLPLIGNRVITKIFQFSPPTNFGMVYRDEIDKASNISTYLYANVVDIETAETAQRATRLRVACLQSNKFWIEAKMFILAAGGIENARLLLISNKVERNGLGNQNDLVGRFFMEHPYLNSGEFLPSDPHISLDSYFNHKVNKPPFAGRVAGVLSIADHVQRNEKMVNCIMFFPPRYKTEKEFASEGVKSLIHILRTIRIRSFPDDFGDHLKNVIKDIDDVAITAYRKLAKSGDSPVDRLIPRTYIEAAPNPDSRLSLSDERDRLGMQQVRLNWRLSPIDKRSIRRAHEIIGAELGRAGLGRFRVTFDDDDTMWPSSLGGGGHHMGTTRMHADHKKGVVDENCKVHGISNLFITGSSVFPTAGSANPMHTTVALAVRLADHVKRVMQ
jgi:choline dehydrogenase-like flavoprotein